MDDQGASDKHDREQKAKREKFERMPGQKKPTKEEYAALVIYANGKGIDR